MVGRVCIKSIYLYLRERLLRDLFLRDLLPPSLEFVGSTVSSLFTNSNNDTIASNFSLVISLRCKCVIRPSKIPSFKEPSIKCISVSVFANSSPISITEYYNLSNVKCKSFLD